MGGPDIPPRIYNEATHLLTLVTDPFRHYLETSFIFHLLGGSQNAHWIPWMESRKDYLLSGIWTAEDVLQMPPDQRHRNYADRLENDRGDYTSYHFHRVSLVRGSFLQKDLRFKSNTPPLVLSSHHQCFRSSVSPRKTGFV